MAVFTFLDALDWHGTAIHPFCTHEGSGLGTIIPDIKKHAPGAKVTGGLAIYGSQADQAADAISCWISQQ